MNLLEMNNFYEYNNLKRISKETYESILESDNGSELISLAFHARYYNKVYKKVMNGNDEELKKYYKENNTLVNPHDILKIFLNKKDITGLWMLTGRYKNFINEIYNHVKDSDDENYKLEFIRMFDVSLDNKIDFLENINIPKKIFWDKIVKKERLSSSNIINYMLKKYDAVILFMYLYKVNMIVSELQYKRLLKLLEIQKEDFIEIDEEFYNNYLKELTENCWDRMNEKKLTNYSNKNSFDDILKAKYVYDEKDQITFDTVFVKKI